MRGTLGRRRADARVGSPKYQVGDLLITVVSDGTMWLDGGAVFGLVPKVLWSRVVEEINDRNEIPMGLNCLLLESGGKTVLIDTGMGNKDFSQRRERGAPVSHGRLLEDLASNGVRPGDVDIVINTHLHSDHCGWNTYREGEAVRPTFPNARYYIQRGEWEAATHPNERTRGTYLEENLRPVEEAGLLELVEGDAPITADIRMIETPGHSDTHASVVISRGGERAVYLGDVTQHWAQLERAAWLSAFDILPLVNMETKKRLIAEAIAQRQLLICVHNPYPGVGRMTSAEGKPHFVPEST